MLLRINGLITQKLALTNSLASVIRAY